MTRVFYIGCVLLHGAVQGWLILRLIDGMLEPKRTELQNRTGQAVILLMIIACHLGNLLWNQGDFSNPVLLLGILLTTAGSLGLYHCGILYAFCLNGLGWLGITLMDFFAWTFLPLAKGAAGLQSGGLSAASPESGCYLLLGNTIMIASGIFLHKRLAENKQKLSEYRQALPVLIIPMLPSFLCFQMLPEHMLVPWAAFLFCCILLFSLFWLGMLKHDAAIENDMLQLKMSLLEDKYQALLENNSRHAILVHDIKNHLRTVSTMLEQKKQEEAVQYISQLSGDIGDAASVPWSSHEMLDLILNMKFQEARKAHIAVECHCDNMSGLSLKPVQICALFSNLLDNAIEANMECPPDMERKMVLLCTRRERMLIVTLSNPVAGIPKAGMAKRGKEPHGFGMRSIQKVIDSYHGYRQIEMSGNEYRISIYLAAFDGQET